MQNIFLHTLFNLIILTGIIWFFNIIYLIIKKIYNFQKKFFIKYKKNSINDYQIKKNQSIIKIIGSFFPILIIIFCIRCFIFESFNISSQSMIPTLLPGDCILVTKFIYGINNPFTKNRIIQFNHPKRGEVVVLNDTQNNYKNYIKRIIGIPGDKIYYDEINKKITIYKKYHLQNKYNQKIFINYYAINNQINRYFNQIQKEKHIIIKIYLENINPNKHHILIIQNHPNKSKSYYYSKEKIKNTWIIPDGYYFVMGDNRNNSLDSRYFGLVPEQNIIGKASYIWISFEKQPNSWFKKIRFNRIGKIN